ncbi:polymer-forming cytoskeletal protein [Leucothrix sargassi]|nr:polymer-forming cytoskeletal protein [Leucothrix sargassi]
MFKKNKKKSVKPAAPAKKPSVDASLNRKLKIAGDVYFSGILHVECTVEGDLISDDEKSTLILSDAGHIKGSVKAANVMVNGRIDGNVLANNKVELYEKSRINGDLHYNLLEMAVGAGVNGKLVHHELVSLTPNKLPFEVESATASGNVSVK